MERKLINGMKNKNKQNKEIDIGQLKSMLRGMMITSPTPWTIQAKTGDIIDNNGRFVARVGWGIEKFKHPVDQNNRELILKAVQFYMEQKELEARKAKAEAKAKELPETIHDGLLQVDESTIGTTSTKDEPTALAFTKMTEDGIEDVEPAIHATDEMREQFLKNQLKVEQ